jgi:MFS family permease
VFAGGLICGAYIGKVPPALPAQRLELGLTLVESGFIATTFNVIGMFVGMFVGVLCDRFGHKRLGLAGLAVMCLAGLLGAAAWDFASLLASRFLEGVGFILFTVAGSALMAATADAAGRPKVMGLWSSYMPSGGSAAILLAPLILATWGWRGLWVTLSVVAAGCFLCLAPRAHAALRQRELAEAGARVARPARERGVGAPVRVLRRAVDLGDDLASHLPGGRARHCSRGCLAPHRAHGAGQRAGQSRRRLAARARRAPRAADPRRLRGDGRDRHRDVEQRTAGRAAVPRCADVFLLCRRDPPASSLAWWCMRNPQHVGTTNGMVMQTSQAGQFFGPIVLAWLASNFGGWGASLWAMLGFAACGALCGYAVLRIEARPAR